MVVVVGVEGAKSWEVGGREGSEVGCRQNGEAGGSGRAAGRQAVRAGRQAGRWQAGRQEGQVNVGRSGGGQAGSRGRCGNGRQEWHRQEGGQPRHVQQSNMLARAQYRCHVAVTPLCRPPCAESRTSARFCSAIVSCDIADTKKAARGYDAEYWRSVAARPIRGAIRSPPPRRCGCVTSGTDCFVAF